MKLHKKLKRVDNPVVTESFFSIICPLPSIINLYVSLKLYIPITFFLNSGVTRGGRWI